jgi:hypothetical protein
MSFSPRLLFVLLSTIATITLPGLATRAQAQGTGAQINESAVGLVLYVDRSNPLASDQNPGTVSRPLLTLGRAIALAGPRANSGTDIKIGPGIYREVLNLSAFSPSDQAPLILEATDPYQTVISGSDVWTGWQAVGDGTFTLPWPYRWGNAHAPAGWPYLQPIVTRREMVFVNDVALQQVLSTYLSKAGTFNVVEGGNIRIWPPAGTNMSTATVEVATRSGLMQTPNGISNLVLRGLAFIHDNTAVNSIGNGAVKLIGGSNILIDGCVFDYNNWLGLSISGGPAQAITVQNSIADHNGENGIALSKMDNAVYDNNQTSSNNWRGAAGAFVSFDADGMKLSRIHDSTFSNSTSAYNQTGGVWFDTDNTNVVIENMQLCGNQTNGLFIEASQGPVTIDNTLFWGNASNGLQLANSNAVSLTNSLLYANSKAIFIGGSDSPRNVTDFATNANYALLQQNMIINNNDVVGTASTQFFITSSVQSTWALFVQTLTSDFNAYYNKFNGTSFSTKYGRQNLGGWQSSSHQDTHSTSVNPNPILPVTCGVQDPPLGPTNPGPTPTPTPSGTPTPVPSVTPTPTPKPTVTATPTPKPTATPVGSLIGPVTVTPPTVNFGRRLVGARPPVGSITMVNPYNSSGQLVIGHVSITGSGFALLPATTCTPGRSLVPTGQCTVVVTFTPPGVGTQNGSVTITDNASNGPHTIALAGSGY